MATAEEALRKEQAADQASHKANFQQQLDDYAASALTDRTLIDRADFNSKLAAESAKGVNDRSRSRAGVSLSGQAAKQSKRLGDITTRQFTDQSKNSAVLDQDERNTKVLGDSLNMYNTLGQTGSDALRNAAGLESTRISGNKKRSADAFATNLGTATSLASMMIMM
jgi:hypothetical protein|tara:strand:- start:125 stop:625 length:501 start_codon:yes stop_codon:yes gene_type:complete